jgi:hypothetical protein
LADRSWIAGGRRSGDLPQSASDNAHATGCTAIRCRKSETGLSLTNEQFCVSSCCDRSRPFRGFCRCGKGRKNFIFSKIPHNPLKRLDSDERIQGNPSLSNPLFCPFQPLECDRPRKSKPDQPKGGGQMKGQAAG